MTADDDIISMVVIKIIIILTIMMMVMGTMTLMKIMMLQAPICDNVLQVLDIGDPKPKS